MIAAGLHAYFEAYLAETERLLANNDQMGFYTHLNPFRTAVPFWGQSSLISSTLPPNRDCGSKGVKSAVVLEGIKARSEQFVRDEDATLLRDKVRIRERWAGFCHQLLNTKSLKLDPTIIDLLASRPLKLSL